MGAEGFAPCQPGIFPTFYLSGHPLNVLTYPRFCQTCSRLCQESDFIQSELIEWDDEDETGQNEIYFVDEDFDLNSIMQKKSLLKMSVENFGVNDAWHSNLKQFVLNAI